MGDNEITITYETLFELLRREKSRDELQPLSPTFFNDVIDYLRDKLGILKSQENQLFSEEKEKTQIQLNNIKKIIMDLYSRREKKIINMAIMKARTKSNLVNTSALLEDEKKLFDNMVTVLSNFRICILDKVANGENPVCVSNMVMNNPIKKQVEEATEPTQEVPQEATTPVLEASEPENTAEKPKDFKRDADNQQSKALKIKCLSVIPKFVGPNLEIYGPFNQGDTIELPEPISKILVEKGKAENLEIKQVM